MAFRGAMALKTGDQVIPDDTTTQVTFQTVDYDTDGFFVANGSKFVIPAGVSKVRIIGGLVWYADTQGRGYKQGVIKKNGQFFPGGPCTNQRTIIGTTTDLVTQSPVIRVSQGDEFTYECRQNSGDPLGWTLRNSTGTFFAIEVAE